MKDTAFGVIALTVAKLIPASWLFAQAVTRTAGGLRFFTDGEFSVMQAVADRIIGPSPSGHPGSREIDVATRADRFLASADPEIQGQFHLLLTIFNSAFAAILFNFHFSTFLDMTGIEQDSYLEGWMTSRLAFRRSGFQALKHLSMSMFYTDSRTWEEFGYQPVYIPEDQR